MVLLADLPASVAVTDARPSPTEPLIIAYLELAPEAAGVEVLFNTRTDGDKSDLWAALFAAQEAGHITVVPALTALEDPVESGHIYTGGHITVRAITPDTLP